MTKNKIWIKIIRIDDKKTEIWIKMSRFDDKKLRTV